MKKGPKGIRKKKVKDFKTLQRGDWIKVVGGSGPYHTDEYGERSYMVDRGKYLVSHIDNTGIHAYGDTGYNYLYMGERCASPMLDTITRSPCKILLLKNMPAPRSKKGRKAS